MCLIHTIFAHHRPETRAQAARRPDHTEVAESATTLERR